MLAIIIILFPAAVMVMWHRYLIGKNIVNVFVEYIGAVLLINCMLMLAAYVIGGSVHSIAAIINAHVRYALIYLMLSMIMAIGIPWICNDICRHAVTRMSSAAFKDNCYANKLRPEGCNKIYAWLYEQWSKNGGFSCIIPVLTAAVCFLCTLLFAGVSDINNTVIIISWICAVATCSLYLIYTRRRLSMKAVVVLLFITGFLLRFNYVLYTDISVNASVRQHDVGTFFENDIGHAAYIEWFFHRWFALIEDPTRGQFYHPPLHHFLAAVWMHIFTRFFSFGAERAVSSIQFLTLFYSSCCMIVMERILSALDIRRTGKLLAFSLIVFHPTFIILSGSINNDILSVLLTLLAIYATIRWYQCPTIKMIMLIAISVGLGMMTKLTAAVVAPPIALVFLIKLIQTRKQERRQMLKCIGQYVFFGCVCIPLGMWYPLWKFIRYNVPLNYVQKLSFEIDQYVGYHSAYERLLDFSYYPFRSPYISWDYYEYNPFVAIIKSSMFGEYDWGNNGTLIFSSRLLLYVNILLIILSILAMIFCVVKKDETLDGALKIFLIFYHTILFVYFVVFCFQYPHTCSMDYRYLVPTCILGAVYIGFMYDRMSEVSCRWSNVAKIIRCCAISGVCLFCILASTVYVIYGI